MEAKKLSTLWFDNPPVEPDFVVVLEVEVGVVPLVLLGAVLKATEPAVGFPNASYRAAPDTAPAVSNTTRTDPSRSAPYQATPPPASEGVRAGDAASDPSLPTTWMEGSEAA